MVNRDLLIGENLAQDCMTKGVEVYLRIAVPVLNTRRYHILEMLIEKFKKKNDGIVIVTIIYGTQNFNLILVYYSLLS